jgi:hypothetical protein
MSVIQVGLVDTTGEVNPESVQAAASALNLQVMRDLPQFWNVQASVQYLPHASKIPANVWPVQLVKSLPPGEGGFHLDRHNQPYAKVIAAPDDDSWTIDASRETIEMLIDPSGNRMQSSVAIEIVGDKVQDGTGQFNYLVEGCDPCEANNFGYTVLGVVVSDFITPHYYDPLVTQGTRYSFTGAVKAPRQLLPGGYISFVNQETDEWQQILWVDPTKPPQLNDLGPATGKQRSMREWVDNEMTKKGTHEKQEEMIRHRTPKLAKRDHQRRDKLDKVASMRARLYAK